jgi:2-aminoadipate transaminase
MATILSKLLPKSVQWTHPQGGYFIWLMLPSDVDTVALREKSIAAIHVGFTPGKWFSQCENFGIRLCYAFYDPDTLATATRNLCEFLSRELE